MRVHRSAVACLSVKMPVTTKRCINCGCAGQGTNRVRRNAGALSLPMSLVERRHIADFSRTSCRCEMSY